MKVLQPSQFADVFFEQFLILLLGFANSLDRGGPVPQFTLFSGTNAKGI